MDQKNLNSGLKPTGRIMMLFILAVFSILFLITGISFAMIAHTGTARNEDLLVLALDNQLVTEPLPSRRGTITDRTGIVIATEHPSHTMFANFNPDWGTVVQDIEDTARKLADVIEMEKDEIVQILSQEYNEEGNPIWQAEFGHAGRRLPFSCMSAVEELELDGIYFRRDMTRFYPQGEFASHTVGYTMFSEADDDRPEEIIGVMGIESYFNDRLTGQSGKVQFQRDSRGFRQPGHEPNYIDEPLDGFEIRLTIDNTIQVFLETAMTEVAQQTEPEKIVAIVMDATTGEILAAGSRPTFNPNDRDPQSYANAIMYQFEPGSTLKMFAYAAAINEGNYEGDQTFFSGMRELPNNTFVHDHPLIPRREMTFDDGFFISANTATIDLLRDVSPSVFLDYLSEFGFGLATGLTLPDEHAGRMPNELSIVDAIMSSFGQGISVTPIQQVQALSAFLNDGEMVRPQLISEIYDPNTSEIIYQFERDVVANPISADTADQMRELMAGVVDSYVGTGRVHYLLDVPSGGKTGTAEVPDPDPEVEGYLEGVHIYSYIGFAPADDPEVITFVAIKNPNLDQHQMSGHPYVGQIYRFVMSNTLNYLGLTQEQALAEETDLPQFERTQTPSVVNLTTDEAISVVEEFDLTPIVIGDGANVFRQEPMPSASIIAQDKVFIQTGMEDLIPDFTGWTRLQITQYAMLLDLDLHISGSGGLGVSQTIRAGSLVRQGDSLMVTLE